jgi:hypothetical protein
MLECLEHIQNIVRNHYCATSFAITSAQTRLMARTAHLPNLLIQEQGALRPMQTMATTNTTSD